MDTTTTCTVTSDALGEEEERQMSLLEKLRKKLVVVNCQSIEEKTTKKSLILAHKSEFPSSMRSVIDRIAENNPTHFNMYLLGMAKAYLFGGLSFMRREGLGLVPRDWNGLDDSVDSNDQVEVVIRCYPQVLEPDRWRTPTSTNLKPKLDYSMILLTLHARTVPFVPLLANLTEEFDVGKFSAKQKAEMSIAVWKELICNTFGPRYLALKKSTPELDEASLETLRCLYQQGIVTSEMVQELTYHLLSNVDMKERDAAFLPTRFQALVEWNPIIVAEYRNKNGKRSLLQGFMDYCQTGYKSGTFNVTMKLFDLGATHYPLELGFLFHKSVYKIIRDFATSWGNRFENRVRRKLLAALKRKKENNTITRQELLVAAASNPEIALDGVYILLRIDPIEALRTVTLQER